VTLRGTTVLVTGSTEGIGRAAASELARMGASVIVTGRSADKARTVVETIRTRTGNSEVTAVTADLSVQSGVRYLAAEAKSRFGHLDVLINNAGAYHVTRRLTRDGIEYTFALNHLAPFLLTGLLYDLLQESRAARVITVSSMAHWSGRIDLTDLNGSRRYSGARAYSQTRLANVLFSAELARRASASGTSLTSNAVSPGAVRTSFLGKRSSRGFAPLERVTGPFLRTPERGGEELVFLAASPASPGSPGRRAGIFADCRPARSARRARRPDLAARLWEASEELTGTRWP
jgi:NAD(P)-dependent dehydrogenase (short-subunit alcohol dehydrogenase family)